jgi:ATP-dependent Clp protease ATP-binding subunit ClpC
VSSEIGDLLDSAAEISKQRGKYFVGVEHLFEAIAQTSHKLPKPIAEKYLGLLQKTSQAAQAHSWQGVPPTVGGEVYYTPRCAGLTSEAARLSDRLGNFEAVTGHLLLAILSDAHALPSRCMDQVKKARGNLINDLRSELLRLKIGGGKPASAPASGDAAPQMRASHSSTAKTAESGGEEEDKKPTIEEFTRDLTEMARMGKIQRAIGRNKEVMELVEISARQGKSNVIIVGEAGTGKTKIVEDLACKFVAGDFEGVIEQNRILELNISALMSGTQYRGGFEEKIMALLKELEGRKDTILFIDEIHMIMGAGATDGDSVDLANLLKPALERGEISVIGATTLKEYRAFIGKDPALERRFQMLRIEQLTPKATIEVLKKLAPQLEAHHKVRISDEALEAAVKLTERYMPNRTFPDKAIDMLDRACARHRINAVMNKDTKPGGITPHSIRKVVSQAASVPIEDITHEDRMRLSNMADLIKQKIIGQDEAVERVTAAIKKSRAGLADPNRPDAVLLFLGPTGVGKTQLCKELAKSVFGSSNHLITFDMSEYLESHSVSKLIGAPPGYVGSEQEGLLTAAVQNSPFSIILFDEIEKAHPQIFDIFLPILDEGRLKDSDGKIINFKNTIIIFTSNIGAEALSRGGADTARGDVMDALREHFRPDFINRIDEIVPFYPLLQEDVRTVLRLMLDEVRGRIYDRRMGIRMYQRAYEFLGEKGYNREYGARELKRTVERLIAGPISEKIMDGTFTDGDMIDVMMNGDQLEFKKGKPKGESSKATKAVSS